MFFTLKYFYSGQAFFRDLGSNVLHKKHGKPCISWYSNKTTELKNQTFKQTKKSAASCAKKQVFLRD